MARGSLAAAVAIVLFIPGGCSPRTMGPDDLGTGADDSGAPQTVQLRLTKVADGFVAPVGLVAPPDGTGRLFVVDQASVVRIVDLDGALLPTPFVDVSDRMVELAGGYDERGLLSLAFHPDYATNGRLFVCYNAPLDGDDPANFNSRLRISEFQVSADDSNVADADSEIVLLEILKPQSNHNGGQLVFGPEGMLYFSVGDGGAGNDVGVGHTAGLGNGQDPTNLLGTVLRFDADTPGELNVPVDNPFIGDVDILDEIYAYGFRNPWRCSFDVGGDSRMFCADVGQNLFEEVSIVQAGGNFGWNIKEASSCFDPARANSPPVECADRGARGQPLIDPIIEYSHLEGNRSRLAVIGGYVYRGRRSPDLVGKYIFGDWSDSFVAPGGTIFVAEEGGDGQWSFGEAEIDGMEDGQLNRYVLGFGQDADGEVYVLTSQRGGPSGTSGEVWRIQHLDRRSRAPAKESRLVPTGPFPLTPTQFSL